MSIFSFFVATSSLFLVLQQAVKFSQVTACRQEAWLKSTELMTHQKLDGSQTTFINHQKCGYLIYGKEMIAWREIKSSKMHHFHVKLKGQL